MGIDLDGFAGGGTMSEILVRPALAADVPDLLRMMRELGAHDGLSHALKATEATLLRDGFGPAPRFEALVAEVGAKVAAYASFTQPFAVWRGSTYLAVDDVYVRADFRGAGVGKALMLRLREIGLERGVDLRWEVETENARAIAFYQGLGARLRIKGFCYWQVTG